MFGFTHGGNMSAHDRYITREPERSEVPEMDESDAIAMLKRAVAKDYASTYLRGGKLDPIAKHVIERIVDLIVEDDDIKNAVLAVWEDGINEAWAEEVADRDSLDDGDRAYDEAKDRKLEEEGDRHV